jgi:hypothetical protein
MFGDEKRLLREGKASLLHVGDKLRADLVVGAFYFKCTT